MHQHHGTSESHSSLAGSSSVAAGTGTGYNLASVSCSTKVEPIRLSQNWTIENFAPLLKLCKPGHCLRSHVFRHPNQQESTWQLCLYPAGKRPENAGFVSLFLKMSSTSPNKEILVTAEYKFYFLDDNNKQVKFTNVNVGDFHAKPPKCGHSWGLRNIPRNRVLNSLNSDGSLLIHCQIEFLPDPCRLKSQICRPAPSVFDDEKSYFLPCPVARTFVENSLKCFHEQQFTDCTIVCSSNVDDDPLNFRAVQTTTNKKDDDDDILSDDDDATFKKLDTLIDWPADGGNSVVVVKRPTTPPRAAGRRKAATAVTEFKVHKFVLSAHSPVFRAMFGHEQTLESKHGQIHIKDFKPHVVKSVLMYLYSCGTLFQRRSAAGGETTGSGGGGDNRPGAGDKKVAAAAVPERDESRRGGDEENDDSSSESEDGFSESNYFGHAQFSQSHIADLLAFAEKYSIQHLKLECEHLLSLQIRCHNVCRLLALSDLHRAQKLKQVCLNFLANHHRRDLTSIHDWSKLKVNNPRLTNEILEAMLTSSNCNNSNSNVEGQRSNLDVQEPSSKRSRLGNSYSGVHRR